MMTQELEACLEAMWLQLRQNLSDDGLRLIYADALEDAGLTEEATDQRRIAGLELGLTDGLSVEDAREVAWNYLYHVNGGVMDLDEVDGVEIAQGFDGDLLVSFFRVGDEGVDYVACTARGDLTLSDLCRHR